MPVARSLRRAAAGRGADGGTNEYMAALGSSSSVVAYLRTGTNAFAVGGSNDYATSVVDAAWSPDGNWLITLLVQSTYSLASVYRRSPGTSNLTRTSYDYLSYDANGIGMQFTPDGVGILFAHAAKAVPAIFNPTTGAFALLSAFAEVAGTNLPPRFSPNGTKVLVPSVQSPKYMQMFTRTPGSNIYTEASVDTPMFQGAQLAPPAWHPNSTMVAQLATNASTGSGQLLISIAGSTLATTSTSSGGTAARNYNNAVFSPDGTLLVATGPVSPYVWAWTVGDPTTGTLAATIDVPAAPGACRKPFWSNDGKTLFVVPSTGTASLYAYTVAGTTFTYHSAFTGAGMAHPSGTNLWTSLSPLTN